MEENLVLDFLESYFAKHFLYTVPLTYLIVCHFDILTAIGHAQRRRTSMKARQLRT